MKQRTTNEGKSVTHLQVQCQCQCQLHVHAYILWVKTTVAKRNVKTINRSDNRAANAKGRVKLRAIF